MTTRTLSNFVAGGHADATDGRTSELVDPVTGEVFMEAALSSEADVDRACRAAAEAFETWRDATPADRGLALLRRPLRRDPLHLPNVVLGADVLVDNNARWGLAALNADATLTNVTVSNTRNDDETCI